jgi:hypothetical protein
VPLIHSKERLMQCEQRRYRLQYIYSLSKLAPHPEAWHTSEDGTAEAPVLLQLRPSCSCGKRCKDESRDPPSEDAKELGEVKTTVSSWHPLGEKAADERRSPTSLSRDTVVRISTNLEGCPRRLLKFLPEG